MKCLLLIATILAIALLSVEARRRKKMKKLKRWGDSTNNDSGARDSAADESDVPADSNGDSAADESDVPADSNGDSGDFRVTDFNTDFHKKCRFNPNNAKPGVYPRGGVDYYFQDTLWVKCFYQKDGKPAWRESWKYLNYCYGNDNGKLINGKGYYDSCRNCSVYLTDQSEKMLKCQCKDKEGDYISTKISLDITLSVDDTGNAFCQNGKFRFTPGYNSHKY